MRTALAARAGTLVTDNTKDFPPGARRNGILLVDSTRFLADIAQRLPHAEAAIEEYVRLSPLGPRRSPEG